MAVLKWNKTPIVYKHSIKEAMEQRVKMTVSGVVKGTAATNDIKQNCLDHAKFSAHLSFVDNDWW